jgi:hypothetical protein
MDTLTQTHPFRLTLKECIYHEVIVNAPDLDAAVDHVREQWVTGELDAREHGLIVVLDEDNNELDEIDAWSSSPLSIWEP